MKDPVRLRKSRGKKVLRKVLGEGFGGVVVCDGWRSYPNYTERLQRCWAHLLREARCLGEHVEEAASLSEGLHALYGRVSVPPGDGPPPGLVGEARAEVLRLVGGPFESEECRRFAGKVVNGLDHWFTFLGVPRARTPSQDSNKTRAR